MFIINGRKLTASNGINAKHELTIDSLQIHISEIEKRIPFRDAKFDSIKVVLTRIDQSLFQMNQKKEIINKTLLTTIAQLKNKSIDSLKIIALED